MIKILKNVNDLQTLTWNTQNFDEDEQHCEKLLATDKRSAQVPIIEHYEKIVAFEIAFKNQCGKLLISLKQCCSLRLFFHSFFYAYITFQMLFIDFQWANNFRMRTKMVIVILKFRTFFSETVQATMLLFVKFLWRILSNMYIWHFVSVRFVKQSGH